MSPIDPRRIKRLRSLLLNVLATVGSVSEQIDAVSAELSRPGAADRQIMQASIAEAVDVAQMLPDQAEAILGEFEALADEAEALR